MRSSAQRLIILSFVLALIATSAIFVYLKSLKAPKETQKKITILVAAESIPARTLINKKMVKEIQVADDSIWSEYIKDSSEIVGKYTKESILRDEGFRKDKLLNEAGGEELSLKINGNYRAISLNVTLDRGVSDLLKPSDFVDIVVFLAEKKDGDKLIRPDLAKVILQNVEVLAIDKTLLREEKEQEKADEKELSNFLITLAVSADQIEKLVLAESIGNLKLVLRPLKATDGTELNGTTAEAITLGIETSEEKTASQDKGENINTNNNNNNNNTNNSNAGAEKYKSYTVKRGDTLRKISEELYGDPEKYILIKKANNISAENLIITGEVLKIPTLE